MKRRPRLLSDTQIQTLNDVLIAAGQITSGSLAAPYLFPSVDKTPTAVLLFGIMSTIVLWTTPILLARRVKHL